MEGRAVRGGRRDRGSENGIERWEVEKAIGRLKTGKAAGEDGLENKVWKYGEEGLRKMVWEVCKMVWEGAG